MTSGREVSMQLLCWRAVLDNQRAALKWYKLIIIIIIIIIIILVITLKQGIYSYVPVTNNVSRICSVAAVLYLQIMLHVMLFCR